jgi:hypothetical protein
VPRAPKPAPRAHTRSKLCDGARDSLSVCPSSVCGMCVSSSCPARGLACSATRCALAAAATTALPLLVLGLTQCQKRWLPACTGKQLAGDGNTLAPNSANGGKLGLCPTVRPMDRTSPPLSVPAAPLVGANQAQPASCCADSGRSTARDCTSAQAPCDSTLAYCCAEHSPASQAPCGSTTSTVKLSALWLGLGTLGLWSQG